MSEWKQNDPIKSAIVVFAALTAFVCLFVELIHWVLAK